MSVRPPRTVVRARTQGAIPAGKGTFAAPGPWPPPYLLQEGFGVQLEATHDACPVSAAATRATPLLSPHSCPIPAEFPPYSRLVPRPISALFPALLSASAIPLHTLPGADGCQLLLKLIRRRAWDEPLGGRVLLHPVAVGSGGGVGRRVQGRQEACGPRQRRGRRLVAVVDEVGEEQAVERLVATVRPEAAPVDRPVQLRTLLLIGRRIRRGLRGRREHASEHGHAPWPCPVSLFARQTTC